MRDITYPPIIALARSWFALTGMKLNISGLENIPRQGGAIIAANHVGYVDFVFDGVPAWFACKRFVRFTAKAEVFDHPIAGPIMRSLHHIPVDRANGEKAFRDSVQMAQSGELVGVFPEATISRAMEPKEFKTGAVRMAVEAGVPLIPLVTVGTQFIMTKDRSKDLFGRGKHISIVVGEPMQVTGADPVAETDTLRQTIVSMLDDAIAQYPLSPEGQWWAPARLGGSAPSLEQAAIMDADEKALRAARREAKDN